MDIELECTVEAFADGAHVTVKRGPQRETVAVLQYRIALTNVAEGQAILSSVLANLFQKMDEARANQPRILHARLNGRPANG